MSQTLIAQSQGNSSIKHIYVGSAAPTTGTFVAGDIVINTAPSVSSSRIIFGWICTVGGTPGTWEQAGVSTSAGAGGMSIGGTVTSGTTGSVLFVGAASVLAQDNTNFFWDDTNNRLGILRNTPGSTLETNGNIVLGRLGDGSLSRYIGTGSNAGAIVVGTSGGSQIEFEQSGSDNALHFLIHRNGVGHERAMTINRDGMVGLGKSAASPTYLLDVRGSASSQIHIRSVINTDDGMYLTSNAASAANFTGGAAFNGTNWIAKATTSNSVEALNGVLTFYANQSLTIGNSFTRTQRLAVDPGGGLYYYGTASAPGNAGANDARTYYDSTNQLFKLSKNSGAYGVVDEKIDITDPGTGNAISVAASGVCNLTSGASGETNTLAAPTFVGQRIGLCMRTDGGGDIVITVSAAFNQAGNTVITLDDAGDYVELVGVNIGGVLRWRLVVNDGAVLS